MSDPLSVLIDAQVLRPPRLDDLCEWSENCVESASGSVFTSRDYKRQARMFGFVNTCAECMLEAEMYSRRQTRECVRDE